MEVIFIRAACYGARHYYIIIDDITSFLGYVLPWGQMSYGLLLLLQT